MRRVVVADRRRDAAGATMRRATIANRASRARHAVAMPNTSRASSPLLASHRVVVRLRSARDPLGFDRPATDDAPEFIDRSDLIARN